jgi:hypothetical protein
MHKSARPTARGDHSVSGDHRRPVRALARHLLLPLLVVVPACHDSDNNAAPANTDPAAVEFWNQVAIDATGLDHTPTNQGPTHTFGQQVGPCRASRAMAIVHIAMFEAVNAVVGGYQTYAGVTAAPAGASMRAAVAAAAHDTLVALYSSQSAIFDGHLTTELAAIPAGQSKSDGIGVGQACAAAILAMRNLDGSEHPELAYGTGYIANLNPGHWRQDPISMHPLALGADWAACVPFVVTSANVYRLPVPTDMTTPAWTLAYDEVKVLGGDGVTTPTRRSADQTHQGIYWGYDGVPSLCAPPRLYNQIAVQLADERGLTAIEMARFLAILNTSMADAGLTSWESKYFHDFWRPVTAIREADPGTGPSGLGDGNAGTIGDVNFKPLGAPASNLTGPNFTPPFPAYPSGHATFGGSIFQVMRRFFGTDDIAFTFVSDEYNGVTMDNQGQVRPLTPRSFDNLTQPEDENGQSRIYLGIHWHFDKDGGITMGRQVGDYVFDNAFRPNP